MNNLKDVIVGALLFLLGQTAVWYQLNLQFINDWFKNNNWFMALMGIPISYFFIYGTKYSVEGFNGELWPSRLIGFSLGIFVYALLTWYHLNQSITPKTLVTLILATTIVVIQIVWK